MSTRIDDSNQAAAGAPEGLAPKAKAKGLRTSLRAGDNPGMGPYNGDLVCITRQDGKTIIACYYD
jgi:hypothetical protein